MNRRGFTLIELLAVIAIIAIISLLIIPKVRTVITDSKEKSYNQMIDTIEKSAKTYAYMNINAIDDLITSNGLASITILKLQQEGLLKTDLVDERTKTSISPSSVVTVTKSGNEYIFTYSSSTNLVTLTVNLDGGSITQSFSASYQSNSEVQLINPTKRGNRFIGWEVEGTGSSINNGILTIGTGNTTITATWQSSPNKLLIVNLDGGSIAQVFEHSYIEGSTIKLIDPTKRGNRFIGWEVEGTGSSINNGILTIGTGDTTITATWRTHAATLTLDLDGGSTTQNFNSVYQPNTEIPLQSPTKSGSVFAGWTQTGGSLSENVLTIGINNVTLTANWVAEYIQTYTYSGNYQKWDVPYSGYYKIELWGGSSASAKASYVSGSILLTENESLFFFIGQGSGIWNGGGSSYTQVDSGSNMSYGYVGGGSTDVRLINTSSQTVWDEAPSLYSRIMVAAGASGGVGYQHASRPEEPYTWYRAGSAGGGLIGSSGVNNQVDGTIGGTTSSIGGSYRRGSQSGNSFISGHTGCVSILENSTTKRTGTGGIECLTGTTDNLCSIHYSSKFFIDTSMIDGDGYTWTYEKASTANTNLMPNPIGGNYSSGGHLGNGYVRVTYLGA